MKHVSYEKQENNYSVAWFKLAEFVARGEKERALAMYKLLMHAVEDRPFSLQLEGDLLLAFDDVRALESYEQAADIYKKEERFIEAVAIYEHIVSLIPDKPSYRCALCSLYDRMGAEKKCSDHVKQLAPMLQLSSPEYILQLCEEYEFSPELLLQLTHYQPPIL